MKDEVEVLWLGSDTAMVLVNDGEHCVELGDLTLPKTPSEQQLHDALALQISMLGEPGMTTYKVMAAIQEQFFKEV